MADKKVEDTQPPKKDSKPMDIEQKKKKSLLPLKILKKSKKEMPKKLKNYIRQELILEKDVHIIKPDILKELNTTKSNMKLKKNKLLN